MNKKKVTRAPLKKGFWYWVGWTLGMTWRILFYVGAFIFFVIFFLFSWNYLFSRQRYSVSRKVFPF